MAIHNGGKQKKPMIAVKRANNNEGAASLFSSSLSASLFTWKFAAILLIGVFLLMVTDTIELNVSTKGSSGSGSGGDGMVGRVEEKSPSSTNDVENDKDEKPVVAAVTPPSVQETDAPVTAPVSESTASTAGNDAPVGTDYPPSKRITYQRRGQPMSEEDRQAMIAKWGSWTLVDTKERPQHDYFQAYPNRDIPRDKFPSNAWQIDEDYLAKFLPESLALVERTQKAILEEYGQPVESLSTGGNMFDVEKIPHDDLPTATGLDSTGRGGRFTGRDSNKRGGWTTPNSWDGLKRRLLHALMTEDNFVFAMAGHSAAAGHGNHFQQSYTLQVQWILQGVFARLGIYHEARNFGNGGLGTVQGGIAAAYMYGPDVDMFMWDSGMTEGDEGAPDLLARQQIMTGIKVPVIWTIKASTIKELYLKAGVDVGYIGTGDFGLKAATTLAEMEALPYAIKYMQCQGDIAGVCKGHAYNGRCWVDRDDVTPPTKQQAEPGGRASWHPGNFVHQIRGRVIAYTILQALKEAIEEWKNAPNYVLPDSAWHVTERYETTRRNIRNLDEPVGGCPKEYRKFGYQYMCNTSMKGRTEFTPRAYPTFTNIRTLMRPEIVSEYMNKPPENVYSPPDVFNPDLHPPSGAIDVLNVVEAGVDYSSTLYPDYTTNFYKTPKFEGPPKIDGKLGKGAYLDTQAGDEFCNGSVDSWCKRSSTDTCLMYAHNDGRNGILFDALSGWLVLNLPDLKHGHIELKMETWHWPDGNLITSKWKTVNNEGDRRFLRDSFGHYNNNSNNVTSQNNKTTTTAATSRQLKRAVNPFCDAFKLEIAVDGKVTSYDKDTLFVETVYHHVQRVVEIFTALNQTDYTGGEEKEVEVAIRMTGCPGKTGKAFKLTHVYYS